jgi:hypothetical protein
LLFKLTSLATLFVLPSNIEAVLLPKLLPEPVMYIIYSAI